jgi:hypothetical protein
MSGRGARLAISQAQQEFYEEMRCEFQGLGSGGWHSQREKEYALLAGS